MTRRLNSQRTYGHHVFRSLENKELNTHGLQSDQARGNGHHAHRQREGRELGRHLEELVVREVGAVSHDFTRRNTVDTWLSRRRRGRG